MCFGIDSLSMACNGCVLLAPTFWFGFQKLLLGIVFHPRFQSNFLILVNRTVPITRGMHTGTVNTGRCVRTKNLTVPTDATHKAGCTPLLCAPKPLKLETPYRVQNVG
jgi:hypothetical protein